MTSMGYNWPLLRATREHIATLQAYSEPVTDDEGNKLVLPKPGWYQYQWRCGTGMCFAGWAVVLAGGIFPYASNDFDIDSETGLVRCDIVQAENGARLHISIYARRVLGVPWISPLFSPCNTLRDIDTILDRMEGE